PGRPGRPDPGRGTGGLAADEPGPVAGALEGAGPAGHDDGPEPRHLGRFRRQPGQLGRLSRAPRAPAASPEGAADRQRRGPDRRRAPELRRRPVGRRPRSPGAGDGGG
ncbi:hypothetical protein LTR94_035299, partial [Friedmanniomyces endolithicus]